VDHAPGETTDGIEFERLQRGNGDEVEAWKQMPTTAPEARNVALKRVNDMVGRKARESKTKGRLQGGPQRGKVPYIPQHAPETQGRLGRRCRLSGPTPKRRSKNRAAKKATPVGCTPLSSAHVSVGELKWLRPGQPAT